MFGEIVIEILGTAENDEVNETPKITHQSTITHHELEKKPNITQAQKPTITHHELAKEPTHEDEKLCWYWLWQVVLQYGMFFDETRKFKLQFPISC